MKIGNIVKISHEPVTTICMVDDIDNGMIRTTKCISYFSHHLGWQPTRKFFPTYEGDSLSDCQPIIGRDFDIFYEFFPDKSIYHDL